MKDTLQRLLTEQRDAERWAVERLDARPTGGAWEPARYLDHFTRWRRRFVDFVSAEGRQLPDVDAANAADLARPLPAQDDLVAAWSDALDGVTALLERSSESDLNAPIAWYTAPNLGVGILRNSVNHPSEHLVELAYDLGERGTAAGFARRLAAAVSDAEFRDSDPRFRAAACALRAVAAALDGDPATAHAELDRCRKEKPEFADAVLKDGRWGPLLG